MQVDAIRIIIVIQSQYVLYKYTIYKKVYFIKIILSKNIALRFY